MDADRASRLAEPDRRPRTPRRRSRNAAGVAAPAARRARARRLLAEPVRVHARAELLAGRRGFRLRRDRRDPERACARSPSQPFAPPPSLYTQPRISKVGDIVTVIIMMNDKATLGNALRPVADDQGRHDHRLRLQQRLVVVVLEPARQASSATSRRPPRPRARATSTAPSRSRSRSRPSSLASCRTAISSSPDRRKCGSTTRCGN